jgi:hypothetical protein
MDKPPVRSDPTRAALADAISERDGAKTLLFRAQQAEERGQQLLTQAQNKLAAFDDVDATIVDYRAKQFKSAAEAGAGAPSNLKLPPSLLARKERAQEATATVAAAKSAHQSLAGERERAERALKIAEQKVTALAVEIVTAQGNVEGERLREKWGELWRQADLVAALVGSWLPYPEGLKPARLSRDTAMMVSLVAGFDHRQFTSFGNPELSKAIDRWKAWLAALSINADAEFDGDRAQPTNKETTEQKVA